MRKRLILKFFLASLSASLALVVHAQSSTLPANLPFKRDDLHDAVNLSPWLLIIILAIVVISGLYFVCRSQWQKQPAATKARPDWRRWWSPPQESGLRIVASKRLPMGASLHSIEWEGQSLLVSCSSQGVSVLAQGVAIAQSSDIDDVNANDAEGGA
jgi:hypothetical protein